MTVKATSRDGWDYFPWKWPQNTWNSCCYLSLISSVLWRKWDSNQANQQVNPNGPSNDRGLPRRRHSCMFMTLYHYYKWFILIHRPVPFQLTRRWFCLSQWLWARKKKSDCFDIWVFLFPFHFAPCYFTILKSAVVTVFVASQEIFGTWHLTMQ